MSHLKNINFTYHKFCMQYKKHEILSQSSTSITTNSTTHLSVTHHIRSSQLSSFFPFSASENILSYDRLVLLLLHHPLLCRGLIRILYPFVTLTVFFICSFVRSFIHSFTHSFTSSFFFLFWTFVMSRHAAWGTVKSEHIPIYLLTFKRRIKSHLPFAGIIRSSPYSPRFQDNG